jgi:hypothetical protein
MKPLQKTLTLRSKVVFPPEGSRFLTQRAPGVDNYTAAPQVHCIMRYGQIGAWHIVTYTDDSNVA